MNFPLAKEIYGTPWSVDSVSMLHLSSILKNLQNGIALDVPNTKLNSISLLEIKGETRIINEEWDLLNKDSFEGIGIINLNGPITKSGGMSTFGTKELSSSMLQMSKDSRIKGFVIKTDSGGGASSAVQIMVDAINEVKQIVPVYALVEKGGMAGSAAYGIISACTGIYSEDGMNIVGSVGTMIQFSATPHGNVDTNGEKTISLYATKSTAKNKAFEEAINNDNYKLLINELLDPVNENFISTVVSNRPLLKGTNFDDGHTVFSKDAVGTFIDGIASFEEVVSMILSDSSIESNSNNNNSNSNKMTKEEFKQQHPAVYSEILAEGVSNEKDRVGAWMAYSEADPKAVAEGVSSGKPITSTESNQFLVAIAQKGRVANLASDNIAPIISKETPTEPIVEKTAAQLEIEAASDFNLKI